jgi:hypothetical protein
MSDPCTSVDSTNLKFNCVKDSEGSNLMARLYNLSDHGQLSGSTANTMISNVVAYGYAVATTTCRQSFLADQKLSINCNNAVIGDLVSKNSNCTLCKTMVAEAISKRNALESEAHSQNTNYTEQTASESVLENVNGLMPNQNDGACKYVCLQCVVDNVDQNIQMRIVDECATNTTEFIDAFTTGMSYQAEAELTKHQNALKNSGYDIRNSSDVSNLSIQMATTIKEMTKVSTLSELQSTAILVQETTIDPNSTSVVINNLSQRISVDMFATLVSKIYNDTSVQDAIDYKSKLQEVEIETQFNNLIDRVSSSVNTLDKLLIDIVGKIIITVIALLLTALVILAAFIKFHPSFIFGGAMSNKNTTNP